MSLHLEDIPRDSVLGFAVEMERQLREHDDRPGWRGEHPAHLLQRLRQELKELEAAIPMLFDGDGVDLDQRRREVTAEAADVANFAMMLAEVAGSETFAMDRAATVQALKAGAS